MKIFVSDSQLENCTIKTTKKTTNNTTHYINVTLSDTKK